MNNEQKEKLIQQFLDGQLDAEREQAALRLMAEEEEYRELLHFELYLNQVFTKQKAEADSFSVPRDFTDEVMEAVEQKETERAAVPKKEQQSIGEWVEKKLGGILEPRTVQWRPAYGIAAVLAVIAVVLSLNLGTEVNPSTRQTAQSNLEQQAEDRQPGKVVFSASTEASEQVSARFFYVNDNANSVAVAGDFSNWEPIPMDKKQVDGQTIWTNNIQMKKGEHRYMYIVDGNKWKTDPLANRYKQDGFGNRNAIISL